MLDLLYTFYVLYFLILQILLFEFHIFKHQLSPISLFLQDTF